MYDFPETGRSRLHKEPSTPPCIVVPMAPNLSAQHEATLPYNNELQDLRWQSPAHRRQKKATIEQTSERHFGSPDSHFSAAGRSDSARVIRIVVHGNIANPLHLMVSSLWLKNKHSVVRLYHYLAPSQHARYGTVRRPNKSGNENNSNRTGTSHDTTTTLAPAKTKNTTAA